MKKFLNKIFEKMNISFKEIFKVLFHTVKKYKFIFIQIFQNYEDCKIDYQF